MPSGAAVVDFGVFPGTAQASVDVAGQGSILASSIVESWIDLAASSDHSADEHQVESYEISAGKIVAGTGFTIFMEARAPGTRLYGKFNVWWAWA